MKDPSRMKLTNKHGWRTTRKKATSSINRGRRSTWHTAKYKYQRIRHAASRGFCKCVIYADMLDPKVQLTPEYIRCKCKEFHSECLERIEE